MFHLHCYEQQQKAGNGDKFTASNSGHSSLINLQMYMCPTCNALMDIVDDDDDEITEDEIKTDLSFFLKRDSTVNGSCISQSKENEDFDYEQ